MLQTQICSLGARKNMLLNPGLCLILGVLNGTNIIIMVSTVRTD